MRYLADIRRLLDTLEQTQLPAIDDAARLIVETTQAERSIYAFGCSHANLVAQEMIYRTGGLGVINPIFAPGLMLDIVPFTLGSNMERLEHYGRELVRQRGIGDGDLVILHSVSGRNTVMIDCALELREAGAQIIAITNLTYSRMVESRHPSGKRLFELADVVIDNCGALGDAALSFDALPAPVAPTSTVIGATIVNLIVERTVERMLDAGLQPPVLLSANMPGGDEYNQNVFAEHEAQIHYL